MAQSPRAVQLRPWPPYFQSLARLAFRSLAAIGCNSFQTSVDARAQTAQFIDYSLFGFPARIADICPGWSMPESGASAPVHLSHLHRPFSTKLHEKYGDIASEPNQAPTSLLLAL